MAYSIAYVDPASGYWPLATPGEKKRGIWMAEEAIEGLVSQGEDASVQSVGRAGVVFSGTAIEAMTGTLLVHVRGDGEKSAAEIYREFRGAWSRRDEGTLIVSGGSYGELSCRVRLAEWIGPPLIDPEKAGDTLVELSLVADEGVWWSRDSEYSGTSTVTNSGITYLWPRLRWSGTGGEVVLPSGATFTLPAVDGERTLHLDPDESCVVLRGDGSVDEELWALLSSVPPEGVPDGESRQFTVPAGAVLLAATGWDSPWQ